MDPREPQPEFNTAAGASFRTTHWSLILNAADSQSPDCAIALNTLCRTYWYPLYSFVRRQGRPPHDAQDITQEFFARLLKLNSLRAVARDKGRFRTFLLTSMKNFLCDVADKANTAKRGGGLVPISLDQQDAEHRYNSELSESLAPDKLFDHRWALTVLNNALQQLKSEFTTPTHQAQFNTLKQFLSNEAKPGAYEEIAPTLSMTPRAVAMAVCRFRQPYFDLIRNEVAATVVHPSNIDLEVDYLLQVIGQ
ncbi:MAG: sigma-70 family RNA polymerase sigma factor [Verrucomicrobia bacterium]|nr:sigma-70 family RNA polymerase sigma factor [Verrucomicrobiota bacterium]